MQGNDAFPPREWPRYQPLVVVLAGVCCGIAADRYYPAPALAWWCLAVCAAIGWLALWCARQERVAAACLLLALAAAGGAWHHARWHNFRADEIGLYAGSVAQPALIEAIVSSGPRRIPAPPSDAMSAIERMDRTRLAVQVKSIRNGDNWQKASGRSLLLVDGHLLGVAAGDRLRIACQLSAPSPARNPGEFDYAWHARGDRQLSLLSAEFPECVTVVQKAGGLGPRRWLERFRGSGDEVLWRRLAHERSGLAAALLLGSREQLNDDTTDAFARTGTVHLLSISGLHVAVLATTLFWTMRLGLMPRGMALASVALLVLFYALVISAEPPAVRATILVLLLAASLYWRKRLLPFNALAAAALCVLAMNPADLFRVGPQLSFLAVASLAWFGPRIGRRQSEDPLDRLIREALPWHERAGRWLMRWCWRATLLTACVWGISAPLVMAQFHLVSPATLLLTPLLALPIAVGLITGFAVLVFNWLVPPLGQLAGWICDGCLWLLEGVVDLASRCPGSHVWVPGPEAWWLVVFYGTLAVWGCLPALRPRRRWCAALLAGWTAVGLSAALSRGLQPPKLECTFLSVGHGCCVVLQLPNGRTLMYDCGRLGSPEGAARSASAFLWSRGIMRLDGVIVSHADVDHYNGLPRLLEQFAVGGVYMSPVMLRSDSTAAVQLLERFSEAGMPVATIWANDALSVGPACKIRVLHPLAGGVEGSDNANSLVLAIEYGGRRILLTGDLETPGIEDVLAELPYDCDVLLAPHHGSSRSNPVGFAEWSSPDWVVISGGAGDDHGEVRQAYQAVGARVLDTAISGAVTFRIAGDTLTVDTWEEDVEQSFRLRMADSRRAALWLSCWRR